MILDSISILRHKKVFADTLGCVSFDDMELRRISLLRHRMAFSLGLFFGNLNQLNKTCNQAADAIEKFTDAWKSSGFDQKDDDEDIL